MKRRKIILVIMVSIIFVPFYSISSAFANNTNSIDNWKTFRGNANHTGFSNNEESTDSAKLLWTFSTRDSILSSPAVSNGSVFVGSKDSHIYRINSTNGELIWKFGPVGGEVDSSPAVDDEWVYVSADDGFLYCLNITTGYPRWIKWVGFYSQSSPVVLDNQVYIGSGSRNLLSFNGSDGSLLWSFPTQYDVPSSPAIANGIVYFAAGEKVVYAVNASSGKELWHRSTGSTVSSPSVWNDSVYIGSYDGYVYDLNASTGAQNWVFQTQDEVASSPAVAYGRVYIGSDDNNLYCLNASTGQLLWKSQTGYWIWSSPAVANDNVYVGSEDYNIYSFNAFTGAKEWSYPTGSYVDSSPAVVNNTLYVGSYDGNLYAFTLFNSTEKPELIKPMPLALTTIVFDIAAGAVAAAIIIGTILLMRANSRRRRETVIENVSLKNPSWFLRHIDSLCVLGVLGFSTIFLIVISTGNLGAPFLWAADEKIYSQMAVHMVKSQDYLTPWAFGSQANWVGKPPFSIWLMALSYQALGISNFAARIWPAVSGSWSLVVVFFLGKKLYNVYVGFLSAIVLGTFTTFFALATHAMLDVPLILFMLCSIYFLILSVEPRRSNLYAVLSGLFFGLALMTKQIEALLIPIIAIVYFVASTKGIRFLITRRFALFVGVGFLVVAPWLIYMNFRFGPQFWEDYFLYSVVSRAVSPIEGHSHNYLYYFNYLATSENLLWMILLPFAMVLCAFNSFVKRMKSDMLILLWVSIVLAIFTVAQTKIYYYILPAYPAFAIAIGNFIFKLYKTTKSRLDLRRIRA